jgi:hypothetical protein
MNGIMIPVEDVSAKHVGDHVTVVGMLLCANYKCWLVPKDAARAMASIRMGIRVRLPGLGAEVLESPLARVTNGQPGESVEDVAITGRIAAVEGGECKAELHSVTAVIFHKGSDEHVVQMDRITEVAEWKMQDVNNYVDNPEYHDRLLQKYKDERLR